MGSNERHDLFVYGELRDYDVLEAIVGSRDGEDATLNDYSVNHVSHKGKVFYYSGLFPCKNVTAYGRVLHGISDDMLARIAGYMGPYFNFDILWPKVDGEGTATFAFVASEQMQCGPKWRLSEFTAQNCHDKDYVLNAVIPTMPKMKGPGAEDKVEPIAD